MYSQAEVDRVLGLLSSGKTARDASRITGIGWRTIRRWRAQPPNRAPLAPEDILGPGNEGAYVYLLGLYLGDGSLLKLPRDVFRLDVTLDARYPGIVSAAADAIALVLPLNKIGHRYRENAVDVRCSSKLWPTLFPQHGPGKKHERNVQLVDWQRELTAKHPQALIRGLIHSDGCRYTATQLVNGRKYVYERYAFTNLSEDIREIFAGHLDLLGVSYTRSGNKIQIQRRDAVTALDEFVGPKR